MKFKELFYMLGLKPKVKSFGLDVVNISYGNNQTCEWALWKNPKCPALPRIKDCDILALFLERLLTLFITEFVENKKKNIINT